MTSRKSVSVRQLELLVEYLEGHRDLARGRLNSKEARALKTRLWTDCAGILNAEADGDQRTPKQWNKWYTDFKCRLLNRIRQIRQNQRGTGGGPGVPITSLSPLEERIAALLGADREIVGRSGTPQNEVQISPLSPVLHTISPLPAHPTVSPLPSFSRLPSEDREHIIIYGDIGDVAGGTSTISPPPPHNNTPHSEQEATGPTQNDVTQSEQEATAPRRRRNPRRRFLNRQAPPSSSELERSQDMLASIEKSRIEVERLMALGYSKMADATNKMADAANRMADAANKSADAQCRIAEALENINNTFQSRNARLRIASEDE